MYDIFKARTRQPVKHEATRLLCGEYFITHCLSNKIRVTLGTSQKSAKSSVGSAKNVSTFSKIYIYVTLILYRVSIYLINLYQKALDINNFFFYYYLIFNRYFRLSTRVVISFIIHRDARLIQNSRSLCYLREIPKKDHRQKIL
ncbi:hypothetical protein PUN28_001906 [Cardiocondyla obscurior]|uniref:Uncharacterized protein n=1 Tax=Cardiocondyla obscurior TaxID=286306 RepID=A0AAW2GRV5_9HYME